MLKRLIKQGLNIVDDLVVATDPRAQGPDMLVNVMFHSLYESPAQLGKGELGPNQEVTVADFRGFVEEMLDTGYTIVAPGQLDAGLGTGGRYATITFDDGYFNNTLALDVLNEFRVPATFFVSTDHIQKNKAFWWDAFSRELARKGVSVTDQKAELERVKTWTPEKIDAFLVERFGTSVLLPHSDIDRPFTPHELKQFALNPWVHLGNHTRDHAILTNCTPDEMANQIEACQVALADMVGYRPIVIAYPNGNHSTAAVNAALNAGLRLGFTVAPHRTRLPLVDNTRMTIGRFLFFGGQNIRRQCRQFSARFVPSLTLKNMMHPTY